MNNQKLIIADRTFESRLFLGTGKFGSLRDMAASVVASETNMVTMALKRIDAQSAEDDLLDSLKDQHVIFYPILQEREQQKKRYWQHNWPEKLWKPTG
jgi:thiazole synthase